NQTIIHRLNLRHRQARIHRFDFTSQVRRNTHRFRSCPDDESWSLHRPLPIWDVDVTTRPGLDIQRPDIRGCTYDLNPRRYLRNPSIRRRRLARIGPAAVEPFANGFFIWKPAAREGLADDCDTRRVEPVTLR